MEHPLKVGQAIEVILSVKGREIPCEAEVLELYESSFVISPPKRKGVSIPIGEEAVLIQINSPDAIYTMPCQVEVLDCQRVTLAIPPAEAIRRVQRRKFLRVRTKLACLVETEGEDGEWEESLEASLIDISGGGCALVIGANLPKDRLVRITVELPDEGQLQVLGKVIRSVITGTPQGPSFQLSIEYQFMSEVVRAKVIRYVFSIQRQMAWRAVADRKTGLLNEPFGP